MVSESSTRRPELAGMLSASIAQACSRDPASVTLDTNLLDAGMDSLTLVSVLTQVEAVYELELAPEDTLGLLEAATVAELRDGLEEIIAAQ